jgi:hypothetical protein
MDQIVSIEFICLGIKMSKLIWAIMLQVCRKEVPSLNVYWKRDYPKASVSLSVACDH